MDDGVIEGFSFGFLDGIIIKVWQNSEEMIMRQWVDLFNELCGSQKGQ